MKSYRPVFYLLPLVLFVASALPAAWVGYDPALAMPTLAVLLAGGLLSVLISLAGRSPRVWEWAAGLFVLLGVLVAGYLVTQTGRLGYDEKVGVISRLAAFISSITPDFAYWRPFLNNVAAFLEGVPFLAVGLGLSTPNRKFKLFWFAAAGLILGGLVFSASRGAWLAVAAGALLWAACYWKPARVLAFVCAAGMVALIAFVILRGDITAIGEIPVLSAVLGPLFIRPDRLDVYRNSLALIADTPFTGIGLGDQFALVYSRYELLLPYLFLSYSHNLILEILLEQGLAGFAAWMGLVATVFTAAWNHRHHPHRLRLEAAWVGLAVILLHGVSDALQYDDLRTWLPFFVLTGLFTALLWDHEPQDRRLAWLLPAAAAVLSTGVFLVLVGSLPAAYFTDRGALLQQRADLQEGLSEAESGSLTNRAEAFFRQALQFDPDNLAARRRLGLLLLEQDRFDEAAALLEPVYRDRPEHVAARKGLGLAYLWSGDIPRAIAVLSGMPGIVEELNGLGWFLYHDQHEYQKALYTYQFIDQMKPGQQDTKDMISILEDRLNDSQD